MLVGDGALQAFGFDLKQFFFEKIENAGRARYRRLR